MHFLYLERSKFSSVGDLSEYINPLSASGFYTRAALALNGLARNKLLFYWSEEFYTTEQKILNPSTCLFQPFGKIKIAGSYEDKATPTFEMSAFQCFSFIFL